MRLAINITAALALAACGKPTPVDSNASAAEALPSVPVNTASPTGGPPANAAEPAEPAPAPENAPESAIPAALHGNWGLTPGDCTSTRGDAKGLLIVGPADLRFYESRAVPAASTETTAESVSGTFNFTGEGQAWSKYESLKLRGDKLIRTERDPNTSFTYVRC